MFFSDKGEIPCDALMHGAGQSKSQRRGHVPPRSQAEKKGLCFFLRAGDGALADHKSKSLLERYFFVALWFVY